MAKTKNALVRLISTQGTGVFYVAKISLKAGRKPLNVRKYDKKKRCHVIFKEAKMK